jgi:cytochrome b561
VLITRQPDGSLWDYPLYSYHKSYGTAHALIALTRALAGPGDVSPQREGD